MEAKKEQTPIHTTKSFPPLPLLKLKLGWNLDLDTDIHTFLVQNESTKMFV